MVTIPITDKVLAVLQETEAKSPGRSTPNEELRNMTVEQIAEKMASSLLHTGARERVSQAVQKYNKHKEAHRKPAPTPQKFNKPEGLKEPPKAASKLPIRRQEPRYHRQGRMGLVEIVERTVEQVSKSPGSPEARKARLSKLFQGEGNAGAKILKLLESGEHELVQDPKAFLELLRASGPGAITEELRYCGQDWKAIKLYTVQLPSNYISAVDSIYLDDIERFHFENNQVYMRLETDHRGYREFYSSHAPKMNPLLCTSEANQQYHVLSVKVNTKTMTLAGWHPGLNRFRVPNSGLAMLGIPKL